MKFKKVTKQIIMNENFKQTTHWILNSSLSAVLGCLFVIIFDDYKIVLIGLTIIFLFVLLLSIMILRSSNNFNLVKILKRDQEKGNWKEIIRLAYPLSRPLWLSRKYKLRAELGKLIDEACINLLASSEKNIVVNDRVESINSIRSSILIDDLGWTLYKINCIDQAKENILLGISIAEKGEQYSKVIKGYRHLSGISSELNYPVDKILLLQEKMLNVINSEKFLEVTTEDEQLRTRATLYYALARQNMRLLKKEGNKEKKDKMIKDATDFIEYSVAFLKNRDPSRYAKTFCVRADIHMLEDDIDKLNKAKEILREGLIYCKGQQRRDNYIRVSIMLLKVELKRLRLRTFNENELDEIKKQTKFIFSNVMKEVINSDDEYNYKPEINRLMKEIKIKLKN